MGTRDGVEGAAQFLGAAVFEIGVEIGGITVLVCPPDRLRALILGAAQIIRGVEPCGFDCVPSCHCQLHLCQDALHTLRISLDHRKIDLRTRVRLAPVLLPIAQGANR